MDLDVLLAPLPGHAPTGADLSFSADFDAIREARRSDDPTLAQGEWVTDLKSADWPQVARLCADLLATRSKDLQLAAWWTEAQTRLRGFAGLADGYLLVAGLCDGYWDALHPQADDGDLEQRVGALDWLLGHSITWVRALPLTQAPQGHFGLADFETGHSRRSEDDGVPLPTLEAARRATGHGFYRQLLDALPACRQALQALEQVVDARFGPDGPSFAAVREQLAHLEDVARRFSREAGVLIDEDADAPGDSADTDRRGAPIVLGGDAVVAAGAGPANSGIATRREAIAQLRHVAEFFRRTEPHSPVAYLADKAARWGEMPLHAWLKQVIQDDGTLTRLQELLDLDIPPETVD